MSDAEELLVQAKIALDLLTRIQRIEDAVAALCYLATQDKPVTIEKDKDAHAIKDFLHRRKYEIRNPS